MKILIVDDNPRVRSTLRLLLQVPPPNALHNVPHNVPHIVPHIVKECADGKEAIDVFAEFRPDLVLMDVRMKDVDGIVATKALCEQFPGARVVMVTDYDDPALRRAAANAGAVGYVLKEQLQEIQKFLRA
jgi:DNA-binding NarL/FixJ family response regulator